MSASSFTFAVALMRIESTLLIGQFIKGCAREIRADLSFVKPDLGCNFALIAHSSAESLILHCTPRGCALFRNESLVRIIWNKTCVRSPYGGCQHRDEKLLRYDTSCPASFRQRVSLERCSQHARRSARNQES